MVVALGLSAVGVCPGASAANYAAPPASALTPSWPACAGRRRTQPTSQKAGQFRPAAALGATTSFLEQVDARYGGVTGWLGTHGFGPDDQRRLHAKLRS